MRLIFTFIATALLVVNISCSSKDKNVDDVGSDSSIATKGIEFDSQGSDSGKIEGLSTVNFGYDKANLTSSARKSLSDNAGWIKSNSNSNIQIEGHCDSSGSVEYNLALGERRARAVKKYLESLGIDSGRLSIISYGKEKPVADGDSEAALAQNRRANFLPMPK